MKKIYSCLLLLFFINSPSFAMDPPPRDQNELPKILQRFYSLNLRNDTALSTEFLFGENEDNFLLALVVELRKRNKKFNMYDLIPLCHDISRDYQNSVGKKPKNMAPIIIFLHKLRNSNNYIVAHQIFDELKKRQDIIGFDATGKIPEDKLFEHYIKLRAFIVDLVHEIMKPR